MKTTQTQARHPGERHSGESQARSRFSDGSPLSTEAVGGMFHVSLAASWASFIEAQPFFFMATASADGRCDSSYRGREHDLSGHSQPLLKVLDSKHLVFPDFKGNKVFTSLGNIIVNPNIGLLFIDFQAISRIRINGHAEILEGSDIISRIWPKTERGVMVTIEEAFANCPARIPRMKIMDADPWV